MCIPLHHGVGLPTTNLLQLEEVAPVHHPVTRKRVPKAVKGHVSAQLTAHLFRRKASALEHPMQQLLKGSV